MKLPQWIAHVASTELGDLRWTDGHAHFPFGIVDSAEYFERTFRSAEKSEVATELTLLDAADGYLSPERAVEVLSYFKSVPEELKVATMERLLSYDEAILRAEAIRLWLRIPRTEDGEILDRIFSDDHPSCAIGALRGVAAGWTSFDTSRSHCLLEGLASLAGTSAASAVLLKELIKFNRDDHTGNEKPWPVLGRLLPVVMRVLPYNAAFVEPRLFSVLETALQKLPPATIVDICDGWVSSGNAKYRFVRNLRSDHPSD